MKELSDKNFDQAFKKRITESYPVFEEESWLKMEKKLRKRDRLVFYRNASIILLFLSFGLGFYFIYSKHTAKDQPQIVQKVNTPLLKEERGPQTDPKKITLPSEQTAVNNTTKTFDFLARPTLKQNEIRTHTIPLERIDSNRNTIVLATKASELMATLPQNEVEKPITQNTDNPTVTTSAIAVPDEKPAKPTPIKYRIPISLAISTGPDFNSTAAVLGGRTSMAVGLSVGVGLSKRLGIQTGLIYGSKKYNANGYDYTFNNPNTQTTIESIQAVCKVLEIPLKATYKLIENQNRSIEINAGLSSYIMLKENYVFKYLPYTGRKDRISEFTNANQHFFSVLDLSATYNIKLKSKKFALGFEPYIKIPLGGIGQGNVPLKSSGVSLKLHYDLNKK